MSFIRWLMIVRISFLLLLLIFTEQMVLAQTDTTALEEVSVVETRSSKFAVGSTFLKVDSTTLKSYEGQNLTEVLQFESPVYIKYYSPGNLASTSFRGANSNQTALTWNGFNINNSLNGLFDLSLFPVQAFDELKIQPGASSALWGSGAIGGSIHLGHQANFKKHLNLQTSLQAGSYGYHYESAGIDFGSKKFSSKLMIVNRYADNNFEYAHPDNGETVIQKNNEVRTQGLLSENHFKLSQEDLINLNLWLQQSDRNIPPTIFEKTLANQKDEVLRLTSEWFHHFEKSNLKVRGAWFREDQDYENRTADTVYYNDIQTFIGETEWNFRAGHSHEFDLGYNHTSSAADVQSYQSNEPLWQHREAFFGGYRWNIVKNLNFSVMLRQEVVDQTFVPFTWTAGLNSTLFKQIKVKAQVSKVYRIPTLNDRYWVPGGNPDLSSEEGYAGELTLAWQVQKPKTSWRISFTGYHRDIENWIIWQSQGSYFSPQNLLEVESSGLESNNYIQWRSGDFGVKLNLIGNYNNSVNQKPRGPNDQSVGRQLIYTPSYTGSTGLQVFAYNFSIRYNHSYTGYTYTTSDHSEWLEPYNVANLYLSYSHDWKKFGGNLFFRVNNIWNTDYRVVRNRPMPGINYSFGVNMNLKLNNQK